jgi:RimJ/RimL family protein N-acetyltransferase
VIDEEFISRRTMEATLADGTRVRLRPIVPEDKAHILAAWQRLSPESRYRRFMSPMDELTPEMLAQLTEIDYVDHFAWAAFALDEKGEPGIGVARYVRVKDEPEVAEAAVTVVDDYQGRGVGTLLLQALGAVALENGIKRFRGYVLSDNRAIRELLEELGARVFHDGPGVDVLEVELPSEDDIRGSQVYEALRAVARGEGPHLIRWGALWSRERGEPSA